MAWKTLFAAAAVAAGMLGASGVQAAPDEAASVDRGRRLAQRNCVQCHAIAPRRQSANPAAPPFRELYRRYPAGTLEEAFGAGLLTRHPAMPQIELLPGEIADLTAYVKSLQTTDQAASGRVWPASSVR